MNSPSKKTKKVLLTVACSVLAAAVLVLVFFAGYWVRGAFCATSYDWALQIIRDYYYTDVDTDDAEETAIDALVAKYLDIYSEYYTAEEYAAQQSENAGSRSGFGISCSYIPYIGLTVYSCIGNSPAFRAGIRSGDVLLYGEYEGERTDFTSLSAFSDFIDSVPEDGSITLATEGGAYTLQREDYSTSYVLLATNDNAWTFAGDDALTMTGTAGDAIEYLPDGAAYISLSQFYGNAVNQFLAAAEKINELGCTSLILDLRNDGGGLVSAMQGISGCFEGPAGEVVMTARYKDGSSESYAAASYSAEQTIGSDVDVYVLANSNTASASEALIGALVSYEVLDYNNIYISQYSQEYLDSMNVTAEQVKSGKTYGKGIMQTTFRNFATGEALKLTTAQIYWSNNKTIHGVGLTAEDGCNMVEAPAPLSGDGEELRAAGGMIYGL